MATRYSGDLTIKVSYSDRNYYRTQVLKGPRVLWRGTVNPAAAGFGRGVAYDSAKAYDEIAAAALSFADHEKRGISDGAEMTSSGWRIRRAPPPSRHRYKAPWSRDTSRGRSRMSRRSVKRRSRRRR